MREFFFGKTWKLCFSDVPNLWLKVFSLSKDFPQERISSGSGETGSRGGVAVFFESILAKETL